jgi:hypothetical protein
LVLFLTLPPASDAWAVDVGRLWPVTGAGPLSRESRALARFDAVKLSTRARVVIRQGERNAVEVQAEDNITPLIDAYIDDATLVIEDNRRYTSSQAEVVVTVRHLKSIATTESVALLAEGLKLSSLSVRMGGSSVVSLRAVSINKLHAALGGSSAFKVSGAAAEFSSELGGSAAVEASGLEAGAVSISAGGSAQAVVWAKDSLSLSLGGSSGVSYYGVVAPSLATSGSATVKSLGAAPAKAP